MEKGQQLVLGLLIQIDQQVPATDQIQLGERRVFEDVLGCKNQHFPDVLADAIDIVLQRKKTLQPIGTHIRCNAFRINSRPGGFDGVVVDIGGKNLDADMLFEPFRALAQDNRDGIGFFAAGTAGNPGADNIIFGFACQNLQQGLLLQGLKSIRIPEKIGDPD